MLDPQKLTELEARLRSPVRTVGTSSEDAFDVFDEVRLEAADTIAALLSELERVKGDACPIGISNRLICSAGTCLGCRLDRAEARAASLEAVMAGVVERVRHKKRGSTYRVIGRGELQSGRDLVEGDELVVYQCEADGKIWLRPADEFDDGRFEKLAAILSEPQG